MNEGWFSCELVGTAVDGRKVRGLIRDQGDPGNRATVKFVCESVLSLALQTDELPGGQARGGILTPATGLGDVLAERLRQAGMTIAPLALTAKPIACELELRTQHFALSYGEARRSADRSSTDQRSLSAHSSCPKLLGCS
jgi:hypothetical protein